MKDFVPVVLSVTFLFLILLGCCSYSARAAIATDLYESVYASTGGNIPVQLSGNATAAQRFSAVVPFDAIDVNCPSWGNNIGNLTLTLYRWNTDYKTAVKGAPIASKTFINFADNAWLKLDFPEQPPGEYLWVLSDPTETVGVWKLPKSRSGGTAFLRGRETEGDYMGRIFYTKRPPSTQEPSAAAPHPYPPQPDDNIIDAYSDTWAATDALGRKLPGYEEVGGPREDRFVGLFYWTWHYAWADTFEPRNVTEILKAYPEAIDDLNHPAWGPLYSPHWWGEPLFGYYRSTDPWVLRKHAQMLADAGVDAVFFDCTNGSFTWKESYMELCRVWSEARKQGTNTPKIVFMLAFSPTEESLKAMEELYNDLYKPGLYRELWFYWEGKPLIMAYPDRLSVPTGDAALDKMHKEMLSFFTFRPGQPSYFAGPSRYDHWGWLEIYPQNGYAPDERGGYEQVTVGVAQNYSKERGLTAMNSPNTFGRSYTNAHGQDPRADAYKYGLNFQEQWDRALALDPKMTFITGWNEWIAGRYEEWGGQKNAFPDEFNIEKSRDIEPMKGSFGDNYYYQMVANIRRFKGVRPLPKPSGPVTMKMDGKFDKWNDVAPEFRDHKGDIMHRDCDGWVGTHYENKTGRNDIVMSKVARDKDNLYFYVETAAPLTDKDDPAWMLLFIDVDRDKATGWEGYDFVVNRRSPGHKAILEKNEGGWNWAEVGQIDYAVSGNKLEICIPRSLIGMSGRWLDFEFKWSDNMQEPGNIMDFYLSGDVAPSGRFNFLYRED